MSARRHIKWTVVEVAYVALVIGSALVARHAEAALMAVVGIGVAFPAECLFRLYERRAGTGGAQP